jgi:hypothetical protein
MEFYNKVLCELYEAVFDLNIAPLQFKNYVIEQRVSRWKIQKTIDLLKNSFENIFSDESKDGNAKNVRKFASEMTSFKTGDKAKALTAQDIIEKLLAKVNDVSCTISEKRSMLFNKANEVKPWKANELKFYDNKLDGLKSMKVKLEESHTTIITNCNLLSRKISSKNDAEKECKRKRKRAQENSRKSVTRKAKREFARACDVTKIITSGRIKYESLENGTEKISQVDLCAEPIYKQLKPRYHMTALKTLIAKNYFEDDAVEQVNEIVTSLEKQKQVTSQKKAKNNSCGKKQCTLDFFVKKSLEISSQSDSSISSESEEG